jgi:chaperonin GroES
MGAIRSDQVKPTSDRVLVLKDKPERETAGGIIIPDSARVKARTGKAIAAGPGRTTEDGVFCPNEVKAGDRVLVGDAKGVIVEVEIVGEDGNPTVVECAMLRALDVLGVIEG